MRWIPLDKGWLAGVVLVATAGCSGGGDELEPAAGFGLLSGHTVLLLPVHYTRPVPGGWIGGAQGAQAATRLADLEIAFALSERSGRVRWVTPDEQAEALNRRPAMTVDPYALSADELRRGGRRSRHFRDPLYGEIRMLAALFDTRYAVWPLEVAFESGEGEQAGQLAARTYLLDARAGTILWTGFVRGGEGSPSSPGALAELAQRFAELVSP